ncbi:choline transporter-like protein 1 [Mya arenaria]|uniref:choline transporter-like protein 1 n=1 Tax=Mya arenaria TaxID=6604 RepID=UPI0022E4E85F|nr:choline transporter-like protein 1 [Mya arenaria]
MSCSSCCGAKTKVLPFEGGDDEDAGSTFGPLDQRECRDVIFLIIFIAFLGGVGAIGYLGINHGNPYRLIYGTDSYGNTCNQPNDPIPNVNLSGWDLSGKSKVFFFDPDYFLSMMPDSKIPTFNEDDAEIICVEKCPASEGEVVDYYTQEKVNLCRYDVVPYVADIKKCPKTPVHGHTSILNRCIPKYIIDSINHTANVFMSESPLGEAYLGGNIPQKIFSDIKNTYIEIGYLMGISVGVALLVVILMRFLAAVIVWTLVIAVVFFCLGATAYCWYTWYCLSEDLKAADEVYQTAENYEYVQTWMVYAAIASGITVIVLLILLVLRKRIGLVVQLFTEAGRAIGAMPCLLLQPFWTLIALVVFMAGLGLLASFIETSGLPKVNPVSGHVKLVLEDFWTYLRWYNIFAMLWLGSFIVACQDLVVAGAVSKWYFTRDKKRIGCPIVKSIQRLIMYHLGSVAFGSFIIALVMLARLILAYIQKQLQGKAGKIVDFILKVLQCCLWCFERFLRYLNRNAYIEIAIYGYNFCASAKKAFLMIISNTLRVAAINSIGDFVLFLGKLATVAIIIVIGNEFFKNRDDINYIAVPIFVACAFAFAVSHCFLLIYEITIDTIFLCFCEDCERNDGSASRPYFMSKNLMIYLDNAEKAGPSKETKPAKKRKETTKV